jgi:hypothetical protein
MSKSNKTIDTSYLAAGSERLMAMPDGEELITVQISLGDAFDNWVDGYLTAAIAQVAARGGTLSVGIDEFKAYIATLIHSRVNYVRGRRTIVHPTDLVRVPTFVHVALAGIGEVETEQIGVTFVPEVTFDPTTLLDSNQMSELSNRLAPLEYVGYVLARGYDRDKRGSYDLMSMQYIVNEVKNGVYGHDRSASVAFAPVAYFLQLMQVTPLLGERIRFGETSTLKARLNTLTRVDSTKG